ncbi:uncharacterized protein LOC141853006 [Brevipalpus obovatus]|uniref:uncharacterized protein LOC141853006 n=1 Tax=Brevipalpus obovatus TaxID=246614 RepID=UPI003D9E27E6
MCGDRVYTKMPQEFVVIRCCECETFQVQMSKKSNKWVCKICDQKQSVKKIFYRGSARFCREIVTQVNYTQGELRDGSTTNIEDYLDKLLDHLYDSDTSSTFNSNTNSLFYNNPPLPPPPAMVSTPTMTTDLITSVNNSANTMCPSLDDASVEMESCHLSARKEMLVRKCEDSSNGEMPSIKRTKWDQYC